MPITPGSSFPSKSFARSPFILALLAAGVSFAACNNSPTITPDGGDQGGGQGGGDGSGDIGFVDDGDSGTGSGTPVCGNGVLTKDEACDDGNTKSGDGCSKDCKAVEVGYICARPGQKCRAFARCGDGVVSGAEQCDDKNTDDGDGCSSHCKIELGYACTAAEGEKSSCTTTTCGDGVQEGVETCEDTNALPFDGCSELCQKEPDCSGSSCVSSCGDGFVLGEDCDDGNVTNGDGCSSDCKVEKGYTCTQSDDMHVPAIFHDFNGSNKTNGTSDFEVTGSCTHKNGYVRDQLLADGTPDVVGANDDEATDASACIDHFTSWYHSDAARNATIVGNVPLYEISTGVFGNRMADGSVFVNPNDTASGPHEGNPFFFPIDDVDGTFTPTSQYLDKARVARGPNDEYGNADYTQPAGTFHNFHFTSHIQYYFRYDSTQTATFDFVGDDDVWVFVNKRLALDLGGLHSTLGGSFTIDASSAAAYGGYGSGGFGLEDGKVYTISIFHAERKWDGSTFRLTLSGFNSGRSICESVCGDGIVGGDEECDDGKNDGGQNECAPGCVLAGYCGDGIVQEGEACDVGPTGNATCQGCREIGIK
jgi:fibro-slime domain-containing protein